MDGETIWLELIVLIYGIDIIKCRLMAIVTMPGGDVSGNGYSMVAFAPLFKAGLNGLSNLSRTFSVFGVSLVERLLGLFWWVIHGLLGVISAGHHLPPGWQNGFDIE